MEAQGEAAADILTGGVIARAVEPNTGVDQSHGQGKCLNCGAELTGSYCANCGQPAHLHRSLASLGHDILHGVFHFEGKIWRTIPELFFHPGRLTRRYIAGERAKFVSPMALYLFTVFLMFAVFSFTSSWLTVPDGIDFSAMREWKTNIEEEMAAIDKRVAELRKDLEKTDLSGAAREQTEAKIADELSTREALQAMISGDWKKIAEFEQEQKEREKAEEQNETSAAAEKSPAETKHRFVSTLQDATDNPKLALYKLKSAGYKYSWALIPLSVPFMWLIFFWRRDIYVYDHAIFVTYSISFVMLFVIVVSIAATLGLSAAIWGPALAIIPPLHLYKQLRGAYGLSRFGAFARLFLLTIMISIIITVFAVLLLTLGLVG